jgi:hypothetical protein
MKNTRIKPTLNKVVFAVLILTCLFVFNDIAIGQETCNQKYSETSETWVKGEENEHSFLVAYKKKVGRACRIIVYLEETNFTPTVLRSIGQHLAVEFKEFPTIIVDFSTSKNQILGNLLARKRGRWGFEELPKEEYEKVAIEDKPNTKWHNATYIGGLKNKLEELSYEDVTCKDTSKRLTIVYKKNGISLVKN